MYRIKRVRGLEEATRFQKETKEYIGIEFPLSYLRRSKIFAVYRGEKMVGGFLVVMEGPLRSFESLPNLTYLPRKVDRWDVAEVNALWLAPELRKNALSIIFWLFVISTLLLSGRKYFTYTYSTQKYKLKEFYGRANPQTIYQGKTKVLEGMVEEDFESIDIVSRGNIALAPIRNLKLIFKRVFGSGMTWTSQKKC